MGAVDSERNDGVASQPGKWLSLPQPDMVRVVFVAAALAQLEQSRSNRIGAAWSDAEATQRVAIRHEASAA